MMREGKLLFPIWLAVICVSVSLQAQQLESTAPVEPSGSQSSEHVEEAIDRFSQCYTADTGEPLPDGAEEVLRQAFESMDVSTDGNCGTFAGRLTEAIAEVPPLPDELSLELGGISPDLLGLLPDAQALLSHLDQASLCEALSAGAELSEEEQAGAEELNRVLEGPISGLASHSTCVVGAEEHERCAASLWRLLCDQGLDSAALADESSLLELEGCSAFSDCEAEP